MIGTRILFVLLVGFALAPAAAACPACREVAREAVYGPGFLGTALVLALPLAVIALIAAGLHDGDRWTSRRASRRADRDGGGQPPSLLS